jgi:hypothetical protein
VLVLAHSRITAKDQMWQLHYIYNIFESVSSSVNDVDYDGRHNWKIIGFYYRHMTGVKINIPEILFNIEAHLSFRLPA